MTPADLLTYADLAARWADAVPRWPLVLVLATALARALVAATARVLVAWGPPPWWHPPRTPPEHTPAPPPPGPPPPPPR